MRYRYRTIGVMLPLFALAIIAAAIDAPMANAQTATRQPNVVLIIMDDMGYADIGSYGGGDAKTPHVDRLAREGVRLTEAYANAANCTPTRAALISGRYQQRVGIEWPLGSPSEDDRGLPVTGASLPALLKKNGYSTGLIGKWHLGIQPSFGPNAHGFDQFFGFLSGAVDFYTHRRGDGTPDLYENTTPTEVAGYLTDEITKRAVGFIDAHASAPFFLEVAYNAVHWPFEPPDRPPTDPTKVPRPNATGDLRLYQGPEDLMPATRQDYVRMLERADDGVGAIVATLERRGLARDTLVIFTNDNGGEWLSHNGPLMHRKSTLWEGGIRVPLILRWPGHLPANRSSAQVAITMDLNASILAATGTPSSSAYPPDGIDLLPMLSGRTPIVERPLFWRIVRPEKNQKAMRLGPWKLLIDAGQYLLFEVQTDPGERHDLAAQHPDRVVAMKTRIAEWEADVDRKPQQP